MRLRYAATSSTLVTMPRSRASRISAIPASTVLNSADIVLPARFWPSRANTSHRCERRVACRSPAIQPRWRPTGRRTRAGGSSMSGKFDAVYRRSLENPAAFWSEAAADIDWLKRWDRVLDDRNPPFYRWFAGGRLNTCWNCLDRHVERGRGDQIALIYDSPVTQTIKRISYRDLRDVVARFAGALAGLGVVKGDRVIVYMPMVPEAVIAMLACAR